MFKAVPARPRRLSQTPLELVHHPTSKWIHALPLRNLDLPEMKALLEKALQDHQDTQVNSIDLSGSGTIKFDTSKATFTYDNLDIDLDITAEGIDLPTTTTVNGQFDATIFIKNGGSGSGDVCLVVYNGEGSAVETDPLTGGFTQDLGPDGGFVAQNWDVKYTCTADKLTLQGYAKGVSVWGPYVYTS